MSGKYKKKNPNKDKPLWIAIYICTAILVALLLFVFWMETRMPGEEPPHEETPKQTTAQALPDHGMLTDTTAPASAEETTTTVPIEEITSPASTEGLSVIDLGSGVKITESLPYTGAFMEDRTDEVVSGVLAIQVTNFGDEYIQTMDITLTSGETEAQFSLSTLFPGETVIVLEKNRMPYNTAPKFARAETSAVALFDKHPGMCEDKIEIQCLDGVINISNVSGEDIDGDILVYYKNYVNGKYYGGITYRLRIKGGLKAGEIKQGMAAHFNPDNSIVVFVSCG